MKASPGARSWIAAGVRHELLIRALPALRHDMTGPVSVMRMGLLMLRRQVAAPVIDPATLEQRAALIDSQIAELVNAVRSLRDWELAVDDEGITRHALVAQGVGLMRAAFELQGIHLQVDASLQTQHANEPKWPSGAALRYLFLGALGYLHDTPTDVGAVTVSADGDDALWLRVTAGAADGVDVMAGAHRAPRMLAIDGIALQSLADDLGYALTIERDAVRLALAAA
ncbi:hypothetical protein [Variovorax sp. LT1R16]|uniref:hypothetical protein n=1 Tax=Variovorax sp. LT1R16 TaxID=3443728 RepID=UPI003F49042A